MLKMLLKHLSLPRRGGGVRPVPETLQAVPETLRALPEMLRGQSVATLVMIVPTTVVPGVFRTAIAMKMSTQTTMISERMLQSRAVSMV